MKEIKACCVFKDPLSGLRQFLATPFKNDQNAFHLILKALFVPNIFKIFGSISKLRLISILMTSQPAKETIAIHIFPNISRSKGNQAMKFGQLTEYNIRYIFHEK